MKEEERKIPLEFLQRVETSLAKELMGAFGRASPAFFWTHVEGLKRVAELSRILKDM